MKEKLLYATTNPGKIFEVGKLLNEFGVSILSPRDVGIEPIDVPENWRTLEENAKAKVEAYRSSVTNVIIMTDDTGLEIDALNGEPGIHVRRWVDGKTRMSDEEIIKHCLHRLKGVPYNKRGAQFRTVIALGLPNGQIEFFSGALRGVVQESPADFRIEGFPFESLLFIPEWGMLLGEAHRLPMEQKMTLLSHRERAVQNALPRIKELLVEDVGI